MVMTFMIRWIENIQLRDPQKDVLCIFYNIFDSVPVNAGIIYKEVAREVMDYKQTSPYYAISR